jgi:hypothetical protein
MFGVPKYTVNTAPQQIKAEEAWILRPRCPELCSPATAWSSGLPLAQSHGDKDSCASHFWCPSRAPAAPGWPWNRTPPCCALSSPPPWAPLPTQQRPGAPPQADLRRPDKMGSSVGWSTSRCVPPPGSLVFVAPGRPRLPLRHHYRSWPRRPSLIRTIRPLEDMQERVWGER